MDALDRFLEEDGVGWRDVTSNLVAGHDAEANLITREDGVAAGLEEAMAVFDRLDVDAIAAVEDGDRVAEGDRLLEVAGDAAALLQGERLACNLVASMSGIATATRACVDRAGDVRVAATRKTTPGYRAFEKRAVRLGGGDPHRYNLADAVLIKENHIAVLGLETAVERARERASFTAKIEVEAETREQAERAAAAGADIVLLDNMTPGEVRECVHALPGDVLTEASGGITPENVDEYAGTGVDVVSMGSLTYASNWLDVSMLV